jgi:aryl-alcohol dehydrogenase-like predicted oxidoreductase
MPVNFVSAARAKALSGKVDADAPLPRLAPDQIRHALEASLARLKSSYVDLYQLHWPDRYTPLWGSSVYQKGLEGKHSQQERKSADDKVPFDDVVRCLGELLAAGKIKAWGLSNETSFGVCEWVAAAKRCGVAPPVTIQNDFSLLDRRFASELAETCSSANHNVGLLAYGALCGGTLSGKPASTEGSRHARFPNFQARYHSERSRAAATRYADIARAAGMSPATLALAWAYSRHFMAAVIIGATSVAQLTENMAALHVQLSKEVLGAIEAVHADIRNPNVRD